MILVGWYQEPSAAVPQSHHPSFDGMQPRTQAESGHCGRAHIHSASEGCLQALPSNYDSAQVVSTLVLVTRDSTTDPLRHPLRLSVGKTGGSCRPRVKKSFI